MVSLCSDVNLCDLAHRGKWTMNGFNTLLEYISPTSSSHHKVARALAGWENPKCMVQPPKREKKTGDADIQRSFAANLFMHHVDRLQKNSFVETLAATLIMYVDATYSLQPAHILHSAMVQAMQEVEPTMSAESAVVTLKAWSASGRKRFVLEDVVSLPLSKTFEQH